MTDRHNQSATSNIPDTIHIAVVGSGGIGKSALSVQYVQSLFTEDYDPTIQDNYSKTALIDGNYVDLDILDTAGQDEFTALREQYMKNQDGFLLCFSLASRETFDKVSEFHKQILRSKAPPGTIDLSSITVPIILVGTKCDMPESNHAVSASEIEETRQLLNIDSIMLTSAKERVNVSEVFETLASRIFKIKSAELRKHNLNQSKNSENDGCKTCGVSKCSIL